MRQCKSGSLVLLVSLFVTLAAGGASKYQVRQSVVDAGGTMFSRSGGYVSGTSAGQAAIGEVTAPSHTASLGFWQGGGPPVSTAVPVVAPDEAPLLEFALGRSAPNPFRGSTEIRYEVAARGSVELVVFDVRGRIVRSLANGEHTPGRYAAAWDGRDESGRQLPPGIFFYRISFPGYTAVRKTVLLE